MSDRRGAASTALGLGGAVLDLVDLPHPVPGDGEQLYEVSAAGINDADTHQSLSRDLDQEGQRH